MDRIPAQIAKTLVDTFHAFNGTKNEFESTFRNGPSYIILKGEVIEDRMEITFVITALHSDVVVSAKPCHYIGSPTDTVQMSNVTAMNVETVDNSHTYLIVETESTMFKVRTGGSA